MNFCVLSEDEFRKFLDKHEQRSFLQTPEIGKVREKDGWSVHYLGLKKNNKLIAATMLVSIKRYFGYKEFYAPRGFLIDYYDKEVLSTFTNEISNYVRKNKGYVFRIDPYIMKIERDINGDIVDGAIDNSIVCDNLLSLGYKKVLKKDLKQVDWMYVLDIENKTCEDILRDMKPNTRNNIRKAEKSGIEIKELELDELDQFYKIMAETGKRKSFSIRNMKYFRDMYEVFSKKGQIKYLVARLDLNKYIDNLESEKDEIMEKLNSLSDSKKNMGKKNSYISNINSINNKIDEAKRIILDDGSIINLSGSMFICTLPEVVYLSSGNYIKYMHFNAQYLIQWEMIKFAIEKGFKTYNFYGISGDFSKDSKEYGVYEFKTGFGGRVVELIGEWEYPVLPKICKVMKMLHK